uniref:Cytochrome c oxidase subunit 2 n=1 Tax=Monoserius pennarius TaxID=2203294 RepID=A0AA96HST6_9CNID|nr:cytochrome c oxidase subunit II [Monoserius pennarius]WNO18773.1 cytochrome c oxidase subunit 2 [Monoserius pennarius]
MPNLDWKQILSIFFNSNSIDCTHKKKFLPSIIDFQDTLGSSLFEQLIYLHDYIMLFVVVILILVGWTMLACIFNKHYHKYFSHNTAIEIIWICIPGFILFLIGIPSLTLLYWVEEILITPLVIKVTGHQWYWDYEYSNVFSNSCEPVQFDSYMVPHEDLEKGDIRLLQVDSSLHLPEGVGTRFLVTSSDVIHCFTVPTLGIKADAMPGRINDLSVITWRCGLYYGQCSEICGADHPFMPIVVRVVDFEEFTNWLTELSEYESEA